LNPFTIENFRQIRGFGPVGLTHKFSAGSAGPQWKSIRDVLASLGQRWDTGAQAHGSQPCKSPPGQPAACASESRRRLPSCDFSPRLGRG
jgi:hypothetical protein